MAGNNIEGRYLNPLTDYGFKKIFGEKDIMIAFLTDLLTPVSPIEDVIFLDKEMEADGEDMRSVIYDLRCKTQDGGEIILQKAVSVQEGDTPETLQKRVMRQAEWKLMPRAAQMVAKDIRDKGDSYGYIRY